MKEITISSFDEFHGFVQELTFRTAIFRGVTKYSYELITSIGRQQFRNSLQRDERRMFKLFKETALPYLKFMPRNDFEWLAVAQHYGMPTRLLDWTYNPLVALYFAIEKEADTDSAIYAYNSDEVIDTEIINDPFSVVGVIRYRPPYLSERITSQAGLFTLHSNPTEAFDTPDMIKIRLPNDIRRRTKQILYKYGINRKTLFPGLEGITADIAWLNTISY